MYTDDNAPSLYSMRRPRLSDVQLCELRKLKTWPSCGPSVDQAIMERLCETGYVARTYGGWKATEQGRAALRRL